jgi:uncharacterized surface anchored protein
MALTAGIVGLPNVGKSTLFNAITKAGAEAANYPFATIDPNVGMVEVPDERLQKLTELITPKKTVPTTFEFTKEDIASGAEISGATLTVTDAKGNVIDTWTSKSGEAHVIKRLVVGKTYTLREDYAPYGYLKAAESTFTVEDTEKIQCVVMKDEVPTGTIILNKDGEFVTDTILILSSPSSP